jgi:hypothetical protein
MPVNVTISLSEQHGSSRQTRQTRHPAGERYRSRILRSADVCDRAITRLRESARGGSPDLARHQAAHVIVGILPTIVAGRAIHVGDLAG